MGENGQENRHSNTLHIHFRCSQILCDRLDDVVDRLRTEGTTTTRSQVARMILLEHIGVDDPLTAKVEEIIHTMYGAMEEAFGMLLTNTRGDLTKYLSQCINKPKKTDPGYPRRVAGRRRQSASMNG